MPSPPLTVIADGKKFMWDGQTYETRDAADQARQGYERDRFEVRLVEQDGRPLLYTRRAVQQAAGAEDQVPAREGPPHE